MAKAGPTPSGGGGQDGGGHDRQLGVPWSGLLLPLVVHLNVFLLLLVVVFVFSRIVGLVRKVITRTHRFGMMAVVELNGSCRGSRVSVTQNDDLVIQLLLNKIKA